MSRRRARERKGDDSPLWVYLIISALSAALSFCLFCLFSYILNEAGAIRPFERFGEGLFFFCLGPLILATLIGTIAIIIARKYREKLRPVDEYIDAGVSSVAEEGEPEEDEGTSGGKDFGEKNLLE